MNFRYFLPLLLFFSCNLKEPEPLNVVQDYVDFQDGINSINYDINYRIKLLNEVDTTKIKSNVSIIKSQTDTVFGGAFLYSVKDSVNDYTKFYNLSKLYVADNNLGKVIVFNPAKGENWSISNSLDGPIIQSYFLKPEKLLKDIQSNTKKVFFENNSGTLEIEIDYPEEVDVFNKKRKVIYNTAFKKIDKVEFEAQVDYEVQYNVWEFLNTEYNTLSLEILENQFSERTSGYVFEEYSTSQMIDNEILAVGAIAPPLSGVLFNTKQAFNLNDDDAELFILDFWYKSCQPCVKSIPALNAINNKYGEKVKIIGVNPIDTSISSQTKLQEFIIHHKMRYPILLVDKEIASSYKVSTYPTLYILDKNKEIIHSKVGYDKYTKEATDSILFKLLKPKS